MKAILLSAGQGSRLLPLTADTPKCTLDIAGQSLLEWQLHALADNGFHEVVVVTGFRAAQVEAITARFDRLPVRTLYNPFYAVSDNLATCWLAREEMTPPFAIVNGDTIFEAGTLRTLLAGRGDTDITLACDVKAKYDDDDMKVVIDDGRLRRVGKKLDLAQVNGESIGMMVFNEKGAARFRARLEQIMRRDEGNSRWYLSAIDELAQEGGVGVCNIHGHGWCEVDNGADLEHADRVVRGWTRGLGGDDSDGTDGAGAPSMNPTILKFGYPDTLVRAYEHWVVLVRPAQATLGSLVLASTETARSLSEVSAAGFLELAHVTRAIEAALSAAFGYDKLNYLLLMMVDPDVHFHVLPRYGSEREFAGVVFSDPGFPGPPRLDQSTAVDEATLRELVTTLRRNWPE